MHLGELDVPMAERRRAMRTVAAASADAAECRLLLDMLGLEPHRDPPEPRPPTVGAAPPERLEVPAG